MRIDLFAVWFMSGLLSRQAERSPAFAMPFLGESSRPELTTAPAPKSFSSEAGAL